MANRVAIGSDHAGFDFKQAIIQVLEGRGLQVEDFGTQGKESCDYPEFALKVARSVASGDSEKGFLICHSGIGMSIAANKVKGVRAALCSSEKTAELSRQHNDANVLCLSAGFTSVDEAKRIVEKWLAASFEAGRHERRVNKIKDYESHEGNVNETINS